MRFLGGKHVPKPAGLQGHVFKLKYIFVMKQTKEAQITSPISLKIGSWSLKQKYNHALITPFVRMYPWYPCKFGQNPSMGFPDD